MMEMFVLFCFFSLIFFFFLSFVISVGAWKRAIYGQAALEDLNRL